MPGTRFREAEELHRLAPLVVQPVGLATVRRGHDRGVIGERRSRSARAAGEHCCEADCGEELQDRLCVHGSCIRASIQEASISAIGAPSRATAGANPSAISVGRDFQLGFVESRPDQSSGVHMFYIGNWIHSFPAELPVVERDARHARAWRPTARSRSARSTGSCSACTSAASEPHAWWEEWCAVAERVERAGDEAAAEGQQRDRGQLLPARRQLLLHRRAHGAAGRAEDSASTARRCAASRKGSSAAIRISRSSTCRTKARRCPRIS